MKSTIFSVLLLVLIYNITVVQCLRHSTSKCFKSLGMESGEIKDEQIRASSYYANYYPQFARLNGNSSWCVTSPHNKTHNEYLEVDLRRIVRLTMLRLQRFDGRHVTKYTIQYKRHKNTKSWRSVVEHLPNNTTKIWSFRGNSNRTMRPRLTRLKGSRIARYVRIIPLEGVGEQWCLRLELYGCEWENKDGLIRYQSNQGNTRGANETEVVMKDSTYDGDATFLGRRQGLLDNGLGQLTDGDIGGNAFWYNLRNGKGFEWVGWFDTHNPTPSILFEFDVPRKFNKIYFHANNRPGNVKIFRSLIVEFSMDNVYFSRKFVFTPSQNLRQKRNQSMWIDVDLKGHIGKYLNCEFTYDGKWIVFSEISFETVPSSIDSTVPSIEPNPTTYELLNTSESTRMTDETLDFPVQREQKKKGNILGTPLIIGMSAIGIVLIVITIVLMIWLRRRHTRIRDRPHEATNSTRINNFISEESTCSKIVKLEPSCSSSDSDDGVDDILLQKTNNFVPRAQPWYKSLDKHKMNNITGLKSWKEKSEDSDEDELEKKFHV